MSFLGWPPLQAIAEQCPYGPRVRRGQMPNATAGCRRDAFSGARVAKDVSVFPAGDVSGHKNLPDRVVQE